MHSNIYIRKFFTIFLLANFALSNTPTKYLHAIFANHKDFISKTLTNSNAPQINAPGIDCHCVSNVVIAPYTMQNILVIQPPVSVYRGYSFSRIQKISFFQHISFGVRGPPPLA